MPASDPNDERVLVLAPVGRDGPVTAERLGEGGVAAEVCVDAAAAARQLAAGAGALLLTEEALEQAGVEELLAQLRAQPAWSELPLIILTRGGEARLDRLLDLAAQAAGVVTLLERPLRQDTLVRTVEVALRSRRRQYQVRDLLEQTRGQNAALRAARVAALNLADDAARARSRADQAAAALQALNEQLEERVAERTAELAASEAKYHSLVDNLNDVVYALDARGLVQYVSPQISRLGLYPRQIQGRPFFDFVLPEDRDRLAAEFQRSMTRGEEFLSEFRVRDGEGRIRWLEDHGRVQHGPDGAITGLTGMLRDVTEAKALEDAVREGRQRLEMALAATELGMWDRDIATGGMLVNERWAAILGYELHEIEPYRQSWEKLVHPEDRAGVEARLAQHLAGDTPRYLAEYRMRAKNGEWRWVESQGRVVERDTEGQPRRMIGTHRDITDRRRAADQLALYQRNLRSLANQAMRVEEAERRRLAVDLHDGLTQTLHLARMKLGTLGQAAPPDVRRRLAEVAGLLDQAVGEAGNLTSELSPPVLHELGLAAAARWLAEDVGRRYSLRVDVQEDQPPDGLEESRAVVLFRCLRELLVNVAKHSRAKRARVVIGRQDGMMTVSVRDDGVGFRPSDERARPLGEPGRGGFGLFSIRERLEHLGGRLSIESAPGKGAVVTVHVPLAVGGDVAAGREATHADPGSDR